MTGLKDAFLSLPNLSQNGCNQDSEGGGGGLLLSVNTLPAHNQRAVNSKMYSASKDLVKQQKDLSASSAINLSK